MPALKVTGVVVRTVNYRDYDRILTLVTREKGLVTVSARGVRRINARWRAAGQLFASGEFLLFSRGERHYLSQAELTSSWYELRSDPEAMTHAAFIASVMEAGSLPDHPNDPLYALLLQALALYCYSEANVFAITDYVLVHALRILGFAIRTQDCVRCHGREPGLFSISSGGLVCAGCRSAVPDAKTLRPNVAAVLSALGTSSPKILQSLPFDAQAFRDLLRVLVAYTQYHLDHHFKAADLLYTFFT